MGHSRSIPFEIWSEIFLLARPAQPQYDVDSFLSNSPTSVSQTCVEWRDIAINSPNLWSSISLMADDGEYYRKDRMPMRICPSLGIIQLWIERSRDFPLDINLNLHWSPQKWDDSVPVPQWLMECLSAIFGTMSRWKTAILDLDIDLDFALELKTMAREPTPLLYSLTTTMCAIERSFLKMEDSDPFRRHEMIAWGDAPRLKHLRLELGDGVTRGILISSSPYDQLTSLRISGERRTGISIVDIVPIFEVGKNLVCCFLDQIRPPTLEDLAKLNMTRNEPACLQHLRHLYISLSDQWYLTHNDIAHSLTFVLNYLTAPVLTTLGMHSDGRYWHPSPYMAFILRSSCPLSTLYFIKTPVYTRDVLECLRHSPDLTRFHVGQEDTLRPIIEPEFARGITAWDEAAQEFTLCPALEIFSLGEVDSLEPEEIDILASIIRSRRCPPDGSPPKFTTFEFDSQNIVKDQQRYRVHPHLDTTALQPILDLIEPPTALDIVLTDGDHVGALWSLYYNYIDE